MNRTPDASPLERNTSDAGIEYHVYESCVAYDFPDSYHPFLRTDSVTVCIGDGLRREQNVFEYGVGGFYEVTRIQDGCVTAVSTADDGSRVSDTVSFDVLGAELVRKTGITTVDPV